MMSMKYRAFPLLFTALLILLLVYSVGRFLNRQSITDTHDEILAIIRSSMEAKSAAPIINAADEELFATVDAETYYNLFMALEGAGELQSLNDISYEVSSSHWWPWLADYQVQYQLSAQYSRGSADAVVTVLWHDGQWGFSHVELAIHTAIAKSITVVATAQPT